MYPEIKLESFHTHTESLCDGLLILEKKVNLRYLVSKPRVYEFYVMQGLFFQIFHVLLLLRGIQVFKNLKLNTDLQNLFKILKLWQQIWFKGLFYD